MSKRDRLKAAEELRELAEVKRREAAALLDTDPYELAVRRAVSQLLWAAVDCINQAKMLEDSMGSKARELQAA